MGRHKTVRVIWLPSGGHIGDAVMVISLFAEAIARQPNIEIHYVVRRNAPLITELASTYPQVRIISVPRSLLGAVKVMAPLFALRATVIAPPAWDVHPLIIKLLALLFRLRGDLVIGFEDGTHFQPWTKTISYNKHAELYIDGLRHAFFAALLPTNPLHSAPNLKLRTTLPAEFPYAHKPYVVVHPFPHMATFKTIPLRRWKDLVVWLQKTYPSHGIVITGAGVDRVQALAVKDVAGEEVYLAIGLPFSTLAGLIEQSHLYIGVDTGPTHIAGVLGVSSIVLAHQNEPTWLPSYNKNAVLLSDTEHCLCRVSGEECLVWEDGKAYRRCVYYLSDETIQDAIRAKLGQPA